MSPLSPEGSKVRHLRFEDVGPNTLKASWDSADGKVLGYRVRCRRQSGPSSVISVSPQIHSVLLTDLAAGTTNKVCVKPVYQAQPGQGLCRMVHMQPGEPGRQAGRWGAVAKGRCPEGHWGAGDPTQRGPPGRAHQLARQRGSAQLPAPKVLSRAGLPPVFQSNTPPSGVRLAARRRVRRGQPCNGLGVAKLLESWRGHWKRWLKVARTPGDPSVFQVQGQAGLTQPQRICCPPSTARKHQGILARLK